MNTLLASCVCAVFVLLALWHVRMAFGAMDGKSGAVPSVASDLRSALFGHERAARGARACQAMPALALNVQRLMVLLGPVPY